MIKSKDISNLSKSKIKKLGNGHKNPLLFFPAADKSAKYHQDGKYIPGTDVPVFCIPMVLLVVVAFTCDRMLNGNCK